MGKAEVQGGYVASRSCISNAMTPLQHGACYVKKRMSGWMSLAFPTSEG
jgi:hypothetical protein